MERHFSLAVCEVSDYWRMQTSVGGRKLNIINKLSELLIRWSQVRLPHGLPVSRRAEEKSWALSISGINTKAFKLSGNRVCLVKQYWPADRAREQAATLYADSKLGRE